MRLVHLIVKNDLNGNRVVNTQMAYERLDDAFNYALDVAYGDYADQDPKLVGNKYGDVITVYVDGDIVARYDIYAIRVKPAIGN